MSFVGFTKRWSDGQSRTNDFYWFSAASCKHPLFGPSTSAGVYTDEFVHFNGQPVGYRDDTAGAVYHIVTDEAGSVRAMTNSTGVKQFESDYYPQGGQRAITATKDSLLKFRAVQRDTESGLDNAARLYNSSTARFLSARAVPARKTQNPQALNKVAAQSSLSLGTQFTFTASIASILASLRSALSQYRQCAVNAMDIGGSDFLGGFGPPDSWVEILCGQPDFGLFQDISDFAVCGCFGPPLQLQGIGCNYGCFCDDGLVGPLHVNGEHNLKCFFVPCPQEVEFLKPWGARIYGGGKETLVGHFPGFCSKH
ncbi:MAG: hypothetical protein ACJ71W_10410 [Terriglobales bacterium]